MYFPTYVRNDGLQRDAYARPKSGFWVFGYENNVLRDVHVICMVVSMCSGASRFLALLLT